MEIKLIKNTEELFIEVEEKDNTSSYYLIEKPDELKNYLENSGIKEEILIKTKLAYNLKFSGYILKNDKSKIDVDSIFDTISKLSPNYLNNEKLIINIQSNIGNANIEEKSIILEIMQQFIFLDLEDLEIYTDYELQNKIIQQNFSLNKEKIKNAISQFEKDILKFETEDKEIKKNKEELLNELKEISKIVNDTDERKMIVSVLAKRNAGKSVIVNSFLGQEFAPTSQEDSTPNAVSYETWDKDYIEVKIEKDENHPDYQKEIIKKFKKSKEVYNFLKEEFLKANNSEFKYMPDVFVKYPGNSDYIIVDTPGPNKNEEHKSVAEKWLKKSDAIVYAVTYGDNEEKESNDFLERVRDELLKENKLQSLLIVANKLDLMYFEKEVSKVKNRYLDKSLKYLKETKNLSVLMMGASALEYFSILEFKNILTKYKIDDVDLSEALDKAFEVKLESEEKTILTSIAKWRIDYSSYYEKRKPTIEDLIKHSNMESIINKVENIARNKAFSEIFAHLFGELDSKFTKIENEFLITRYKEYENQKNEILKDIKDIKEFFNLKENEVKNNFFIRLDNEVENQIDTLYNDISKEFTDVITEALDKNEKEKVQSGETETIKIEGLLHEDLKNKIKKKFPETTKKINQEKDSMIFDLEEKLEKLNEEIKDKINSKEFSKKYNLDLKTPTLSNKFQQEEFQINFKNFEEDLKKYDGMCYELSEITSKKNYKEVRKEGFGNLIKDWTPFCTPEMKKIYCDDGDKEEEYIDSAKVEEKMNDIKNSVISFLSSSIKSDKESSTKAIETQLDEFKKEIENESYRIIRDYKTSQEKIEEVLNSDQKTIESRIAFYNEMNNSFSELKVFIDEVKKI